MPFKWDPAAERNLLLFAIGEMAGPPSTIWPAVAEKIGGGLNANACSQKFYKLKKEADKLLTDNDTPAPDTPAKSTKSSNKKATGSESKRKRNAAQDEETPTKRSKKTAVQRIEVKEESEAKFKTEASDQGDESGRPGE
ncbi:hypothetical protein A1O1_02092 [Capronia coronata CBS 617.96]|uniref:Myb-like domain-containing protein n=1 Tax=Capronia coronata CBS 617.96 TaxID=1182541 RepID=W9YVI7_9EURO|nr:uncharacterized protein A1O1_02092 [Capronia coronata CBS 617.96]EXJ93700.1 hypothetical protein A1O1_02092 [Capronia coronata CBS 617.96]